MLSFSVSPVIPRLGVLLYNMLPRVWGPLGTPKNALANGKRCVFNPGHHDGIYNFSLKDNSPKSILLIVLLRLSAAYARNGR